MALAELLHHATCSISLDQLIRLKLKKINTLENENVPNWVIVELAKKAINLKELVICDFENSSQSAKMLIFDLLKQLFDMGIQPRKLKLIRLGLANEHGQTLFESFISHKCYY